MFLNALSIASDESKDVTIKHKEITLIILNIIIEIAEKAKELKINYSDNVLAIKNYIDNHIYKTISLNDLSSHIAMSQRNMNRLFKKEVGLTVYDYFLNQKIQLVKTMLINTNLSVKEISQKLTFSDVYYFSNLFKKKTGYSPTKYRKMFGGR